MSVLEKQVKIKQWNHENELAKYQYELSLTIAKDGYMQKISTHDNRLVHPDLEDHFNDYLKDVVITVMGFCEFMQMEKEASAENVKAFTQLNTLSQKYYDNVKQSVVVTGIKFTGDDKTAGVILSGKRTVSSGKSTKFETPSITLSATTYGIEEELSQTADMIKSEIYSYVFHNKVANPPMEFTSDEEEVDE